MTSIKAKDDTVMKDIVLKIVLNVKWHSGIISLESLLDFFFPANER